MIGEIAKVVVGSALCSGGLLLILRIASALAHDDLAGSLVWTVILMVALLGAAGGIHGGRR